jgi:hypothetical protein
MTIKIHAVYDEQGRARKIDITPGNFGWPSAFCWKVKAPEAHYADVLALIFNLFSPFADTYGIACDICFTPSSRF